MDAKAKLEKVITSDPIDRTAAMVTSKGIQYESPKKFDQPHWEIAPPTIPLEKGETNWGGHRFGRLTVVGKYCHKSGSQQVAKWLVRCDCSRYELRRVKAMQRTDNPDACCQRCQALRSMKRVQYFRSTGHNITE